MVCIHKMKKMKKIFIALMFISSFAKAQPINGTIGYVPKFVTKSAIINSSIFDNGTSVIIGSTSANAHSILELTSTTKALTVPRMTSSQIATLEGIPAIPGMIAYNSTNNSFWGFTNYVGGIGNQFVTNITNATPSYYSRWVTGTMLATANLYDSLSDWSRLHGLALRAIKLTDGNQGSGKILTSDANGLASWAAAASGITGLTTNFIPRATSSTTLGNSYLSQVGFNIKLASARFITSLDSTKIKLDFGSTGSEYFNMSTDGGVGLKTFIYADTSTITLGKGSYDGVNIATAGTTLFHPSQTTVESSAAISIGTSTATSVGIGRSSHTTTIAGTTSCTTVGIGTSSPVASALLDLTSTTKGLKLPNMTTTQRNAISSPAKGLMVYDATLDSVFWYNTGWHAVGGGGGGGGGTDSAVVVGYGLSKGVSSTKITLKVDTTSGAKTTKIATQYFVNNTDSVGTIIKGTWHGTLVGSTYGGTGVNNGSSTITLGGNLTTSGAYGSTFTMSGTTAVTFPTSGTLATVGMAATTLTDGSTITYDVSASSNAVVTLGGNRTLAISNAVAGQYFTLVVIQDGTGNRTLAMPGSSKVINGGAGVINLSPAISARDVLSCYYDGTYYYWSYGLNYN